MIRFDGYYIFEPVLYQERKEHPPNYLNMAYSFNKNGIVRYTNKWSTEKSEILFTEKDFNDNSDKNCYKINGQEIYFIDNCKKNEYKFFYDIISENEIKYRESGDIMKFVPWKK
ncbi:hypothetical protein BTO04_00445 [Polaribacter sp. SA4-10]|uniref:hypothetical protein n=1 Tax=Polaribacter sp. SA4-10 TaxID=754397 RepID=UPI000B3CA660|nr:hypothetical protein [Polaribacter sp. SA4-10]ARV05252.1 hypothetical protein BTO04_00445 [Polaribacter sp. SA4-10]